MFTPTTIPSACGELACRVTGAGAPLVLLHGGAGSWTHWTRNIDALAAHFRVYAIDLPGCGDSPDVRVDIEHLEYTALVAEALSGFVELQKPFVMIGFSFGAAVAAAVTAQLRDAVSMLALVGPGGFGRPIGRALSLRKVPFGEDEAAVREALTHNLSEMMIFNPDVIDEDTLSLHRDNVVRARFDSRRVSLSDSLLRNLAQIEQPVLVLWGERDSLSHPSVQDRARACRAHGRNVSVEIIPAAGHWVQYEAASAVNKALARFLGQSFSVSATEA
jgi:2-hydroxy-6-oxonona-2,4-dienedioate hydrolase